MKVRTACVLVTVFGLAGTAAAQQVFVYRMDGSVHSIDFRCARSGRSESTPQRSEN